MKATGIVRRFDGLGRIVVPKEIRRTMGVANTDPVEFFVEGDVVMIRKYAPGCTFCGSLVDLSTHWDKPICRKCTQEMAQRGGGLV
ncbi:AbrB/MazE/SpoVT family DNA-binding domain-containing protein [Cohnella cholangitidis]|uniref:AbrB/MazE/SpoVT family DNA-binding domain-containing protein n=1 Tax=Cohnella cholangitidis TaxID=2598458 RepID=A0A7G5C5F7_9BACL|nr:AbrB/MazE/SpoVT family DNA-binding domain-containing protein [Cohnella cholangitidis]QMV44441.1 AbrB/MazE/SpoVT family DNA-binding domain-containing protein [Cohnella cholangitidis]